MQENEAPPCRETPAGADVTLQVSAGKTDGNINSASHVLLQHGKVVWLGTFLFISNVSYNRDFDC